MYLNGLGGLTNQWFLINAFHHSLQVASVVTTEISYHGFSTGELTRNSAESTGLLAFYVYNWVTWLTRSA